MIDATFKSEFGERLKKAAKAAGKTQQEIADIFKKQYGIAISTHSISNHYAGQNLPEYDNLIAYCEVLDVKADYLLFGGEDMKANRPRNDKNESLEQKRAKTAVLALAELLILTKFKVVFTEGKLEYGEKEPDLLSLQLVCGDAYNDWGQLYEEDISFSLWRDFAEQLQKIADIKDDTLSNSEKYGLAEKRFDRDFISGKVGFYLRGGELVGGETVDDDELPF